MSQLEYPSVLVTGAAGFVGRALCAKLTHAGCPVIPAVRHSSGIPIEAIVGNITPSTDWRGALLGCDVVVHLAARVHMMHDAAWDSLAEFCKVNVEGTLNLARQAAEAGVRRFVFLSSVKVNGEATIPGQPFVASHLAAPQDAYAVSKWEAEQGLHRIAAQTGMEIVIIRPPLVYGPGVKANFATMMRWVAHGMPLPLGAVSYNRRSLVALDNLVELIVTCLHHPAAANQTFLVSDGEDLSTAALLIRLGHAIGKPARLIPVPSTVLEAGMRLLGKGGLAQRLLGNLQVDIRHTQDVLDWHPIISIDEGLRRAARS